jgi:hypothetical protein
MSTGLGREDIRALLDDLSAELAARGARAELFLVGGAALAVAYDATRATRDLDAVFVPAGIVRQAAAAVAEQRGLAEDWLNDAVKGFLPGPDPDAQRFYSSDSLIVDVASPRYLLAMKLFAARAEIDADDIILLYRQLGFTTVDEGLDLVEQAYPGRPVPATAARSRRLTWRPDALALRSRSMSGPGRRRSPSHQTARPPTSATRPPAE